jgi:hypothetical protein
MSMVSPILSGEDAVKFMTLAALVAIASVPFVLMTGWRSGRRVVRYSYPDNIFEEELSL